MVYDQRNQTLNYHLPVVVFVVPSLTSSFSFRTLVD